MTHGTLPRSDNNSVPRGAWNGLKLLVYCALATGAGNAEANSAKYLGARWAYEACERAILTHGGYGYAKEFHVERFLREVMIARIAPVAETRY